MASMGTAMRKVDDVVAPKHRPENMRDPAVIARYKAAADEAFASGRIWFNKAKVREARPPADKKALCLFVTEGLKLAEPFTRLTLVREWKLGNSEARDVLARWRKLNWIEAGGDGCRRREEFGHD